MSEMATGRRATDPCECDTFGWLPIPHKLYDCCERCNYDRHRCPCCGDDLLHGVDLCEDARAEYGRSEP